MAPRTPAGRGGRRREGQRARPRHHVLRGQARPARGRRPFATFASGGGFHLQGRRCCQDTQQMGPPEALGERVDLVQN
eukprot:scaffold20361_cov102-Isochrysis_galbana.AAC.5